MKKVLLLGGSGFIGRNLKEYFQLKRTDIHLETPTRQELDLLDEQSVKRYLKTGHFDVVIHAAICNLTKECPVCHMSELEQDLRMYVNLEKYHQEYGKLLYFGSGAEYDKSCDIFSVTENEFPNGVPLNQYGLAKYLIGKNIENSKNIYNLRIFGLFGKYENWKTTFISGACCKVIKNLPVTIRQNVYFDYLYIDDFCNIVGWFTDHTPLHHSYNIVSGKRIDLISIAHMIKEIAQSDVPVYVCKPGLAKEYTASNERLLEEIPDMRYTEMSAAVKELLKYYQTNIKEIDVYSLLYF